MKRSCIESTVSTVKSYIALAMAQVFQITASSYRSWSYVDTHSNQKKPER